MIHKWMIVAALVAVLVILLGAMAGYEMAKQPKTQSSTTLSYQPPGPSRLQQAALGPQVASVPIEPMTEPIVISLLPEAMLQLLTLKEGQSAVFQLNNVSGRIIKGCYDKWTVATKNGTKTLETWGDLTVMLYKLALNAKNFALQIHGKTFHTANAGPRIVMHSAQGDSFDLGAANQAPIYSGIAPLQQTA